MRYVLLLAAVALATVAHGRTLVESYVGPQLTVTVRRVDNQSWNGRIRFQTYDANWRLLSDDEMEVAPLVSEQDRAVVVEILNRVYDRLHSELAIPLPSPTPVATPVP